MIQEGYPPDPPIGLPGMMADVGISDTLSRGADVNIGFGAACCEGAEDSTCKLPLSASDVGNFLGVSVYDASLPPAGWPPGWPGAYGAGSATRLVHRGRVLVQVEEAVTPASPVYVRFAVDTAGGFTVTGTFRASPDPVSGSPTAAFVATGARYLTSASASGLVWLDLNLPG